MKGNFALVFKEVLGHEGGYQSDPRDKGNWTGGEIGKGRNLGTKFGISAQTYPDVDIKGLTVDGARTIYRRDFWDMVQGDELPAGIDLLTFDAAVNSGRGRSVKWLQAALGGIKIDGLLGPGTIEALKACDVPSVIAKACAHRLDFLDDLPTWPTYGGGWTTRVGNIKARALAWAKDPPAQPNMILPRETATEIVMDMATRMGVPADPVVLPRVVHKIAGEEDVAADATSTIVIKLRDGKMLSVTQVP